MEVRTITYITGEGVRHRHFHDSHQLIFVTKGAAEFSINGKKTVAKKGALVVLGRFERHSVLPLTDDFCRYSLRLAVRSQVSTALYSIFSNRPEGFYNVLDMSDSFDETEGIFKRLKTEFENGAPLADDMLKLLIDLLLITVYRSYPKLFATGDDCFETVSDLQRRFETEFSKSYALEQLGAQYNMSVSYLSHSFKKITGCSVMGYLLQCRLTNAKKLLTHSDASISEIMEDCGFSDFSNFSRTFKQNTGYSPTDFRKKYKL